MMNLIKEISGKIRNALSKHRRNKIKKRIENAKKDIPELFMKNNDDGYSLGHAMHVYYEIKGINTTKYHNYIISVLTICIVIIAGIQLLNQYKSYIPENPDIEIKTTSGTSISPSDVARINKLENGTLWMSRDYLGFTISNLGKKDAGYMIFYLIDNTKEYLTHNAYIKNLGSLQTKFFEIPIWSISCSSVYWSSQTDKQNTALYLNKCEKASKNLTKGEKHLILEVNCPGCEFKNDVICYSVNVCIEGGKNILCKGYGNIHNLNEVACPLGLKFP